MTKALESYSKNEREVKSFVINCRGVMDVGETIATIDAGAIVQTDAEGTAIDAGDKIDFQGVTKNDEEICRAGKQKVLIGEGIVGFFVAGKASVGKYLIAIPFTTSEGQDLDAEIVLTIT